MWKLLRMLTRRPNSGLADWLAEADRLGAGLITWKRRGGQWVCFASNLPVPHVASGHTPYEALRELVRFMRRIECRT